MKPSRRVVLACLVFAWATPAQAQIGSNLISCWTLDEASGTRADAVTGSANDLTDNNTVTQGTLVIGNAADFEKDTSEFLSRADNDSLSVTGTGSFTLAAWVQLESEPAANQTILARNTGTAGTSEYVLRRDTATDRFAFYVSNSTGFVSVDFDAINPTTATPYFIVVGHDTDANTIFINVNDGTAETAAFSATIPTTSVEFRIGMDSSAGAVHWDGLIDEVPFYKSALSAADQTALYNGGTGVSCDTIINGAGGSSGPPAGSLMLMGVGR